MQPEQPTTPTAAQSPDSVPAPDPALVRRLWRPVERPGVIDPGPARAILARHQRMVTGLPLAELVARHTGSASDLTGMTVPIVYALPTPSSPPIPDSRPAGAQLTVNVAVSSPIVSARPARSASGPAQSVVGSAQSVVDSASSGSASASSVSPAVSDTRDAPEPQIVQRKLATSPLPGSPSAVPSTDAVVPSTDAMAPAVERPAFPDPRSLDRLPLDLRTPDLGSPDAGWPDAATVSAGLAQPVAGFARSAQSTPSVTAAPGSSVPRSVRPAVSVNRDAAEPLVVQAKAAAPLGLGSPSAVSPLDVPPPPPDVVVPVLGRPEFLDSRPLDLLPLDSLRTLPAAVVTAGRSDRPHSRPAQPLLLVDLAVATAQPAQERPGATGQRGAVVGRTPVAGRVPGVGRDAGAPRRADRPAQPQMQAGRQVTAPIDVEHIVDAVHRRFVRRLAIEAERRAVR